MRLLATSSKSVAIAAAASVLVCHVVEGGAKSTTLRLDDERVPDDSIVSLCFNPSGSHVVAAFSSKRIVCWDVASGCVVGKCFGNKKIVSMHSCVSTKIGVLTNNLYVVNDGTMNKYESFAGIGELDSNDGKLHDYALLDLWHRRFGHVDVNQIKQLIRLNLADGITVDPNMLRTRYHCASCAVAKATKHKHKRRGTWLKLVNNCSDKEIG